MLKNPQFSQISLSPKILLPMIAILLALALIGQTEAWAQWRVECVDCAQPRAFANFYPRAIAGDSQSRPHIAYGKNNLYHAYHDGTRWVTETVDNQPGVGEYASIAIDSSDKVHIAYPDNTKPDTDSSPKPVKYATNAPGSWVITSVDTNTSY